MSCIGLQGAGGRSPRHAHDAATGVARHPTAPVPCVHWLDGSTIAFIGGGNMAERHRRRPGRGRAMTAAAHHRRRAGRGAAAAPGRALRRQRAGGGRCSRSTPPTSSSGRSSRRCSERRAGLRRARRPGAAPERDGRHPQRRARRRDSAASASIRAMPNMPALIGQGIAGLYARPAVDRRRPRPGRRPARAHRRAGLGRPEEALDAVTALSGSGPGLRVPASSRRCSRPAARWASTTARRAASPLQTVAGAAALAAASRRPARRAAPQRHLAGRHDRGGDGRARGARRQGRRSSTPSSPPATGPRTLGDEFGAAG